MRPAALFQRMQLPLTKDLKTFYLAVREDIFLHVMAENAKKTLLPVSC